MKNRKTNEKETTKVVAYMRYSSHNQHETSIEAQRMRINLYCAENGIELIDEYVDRAHTGTHDRRKGFQKLIADAQQKPAWKTILVYDQSRFCRNYSDAVKYENMLNDLGIKLISVTEDFGDSNEGWMMSKVTNVYNEYFSRNNAKITHNRMVNKASKSAHCGGIPPLGYDLDDEGKLVVNPQEAKIVQQIFNMYELGYSKVQIAERLNKDGHTTKVGRPFTKGSFQSILSQEKYTGFYIWNRVSAKNSQHKRNSHAEKPLEEQVRIEGGCPQIIDPAQFERVQELMKNRQGVSVGKKHHYMLSGQKFMRCSKCGALMVGSYRTSHGYSYTTYACPNHRYNGCPTKEIRTEIIDGIVANQLTENLMKRGDWESMIKKLGDTNELAILRYRLQGVEKSIAGVIKAIETNYSEALLERLSLHEAKKEHYEKQIAAIREKNSLQLKNRDEICAAFAEYITNSNDPAVRVYLQQAVKEIKISNEDVSIELEIA